MTGPERRKIIMEYARCIPVMPLGRNKNAIIDDWGKFRDTPLTYQEVEAFLARQNNEHWGVVTGKGKVSKYMGRTADL
jgi:hypothetical protein